LGDFHPGNIALNPRTGAFKWVWIDYADTEKIRTVSMTSQCKQFKKIFLVRLVQELGTPHQAIGEEFRRVFESHLALMYSQHVDCDQVDFKIDNLATKFKEVITRKTIASAVGHMQPAPSLTQATSEVSAAVVKSGAFPTSGTPAPPWQNITQASSAVSAGVVKSGGTSPISVDRSRGMPPPPWNRQSHGIYARDNEHGASSNSVQPPCAEESESIPVEDFIAVIHAKNDEHDALSTSLPEALVPSSRAEESGADVQNKAGGASSTSLQEGLMRPSRAEESGIDAKNDEHGAPSEESVPCPGGRYSFF
jgi:hypothetical protein